MKASGVKVLIKLKFQIQSDKKLQKGRCIGKIKSSIPTVKESFDKAIAQLVSLEAAYPIFAFTTLV